MLVALIMMPPSFFLPSRNLVKDFVFVAPIVIVPFVIREMSHFYGGTTYNDYTRFCPGGLKKCFVGGTGNGFILFRYV
jgi:hypothetical protein